MSFSRRSFLNTAAAGVAFAGFARLARAEDAPLDETYRNEVFGYGPLKADPFGVLDLPEGFAYRIVSQAGERMSDGLFAPYKADGMDCFAAGGSRVILARNHELKPLDRNHGPLGVHERLATEAPHPMLGLGHGKLDPAKAYDLDPQGHPLPGGVSMLTYDLKSGQLVSQHMALTGTAINCAGGRTPWGSWLSCEETLLRAGEGVAKSHGWVFEVPATAKGQVEARPIPALGRIRHEAACVDPRTGIVYLTEDDNDTVGLFYRMLPEAPGELLKGGRLQALAFKGQPGADSRNYDSRAWSEGDWRETEWIDIDGTDNPNNDIAQRGHAKGAAHFARGEGVHFGDGELYFCCTSGGAAKSGQVMRYVPSRFEGQPGEAGEPGRIQLFVETTDEKVLNFADNITVAPWGHLVICEDNYSKEKKNHLRGVTPQGQVYTIGRNVFRDNAEFAGACFSPDGSTLFVNIYWPGITVAITGPWSGFRS